MNAVLSEQLKGYSERIRDSLFWGLVICLCIYKLYLASVVPFVVPLLKPHDDTWFFMTALSMLNGDWMGAVYNNDTHFKGPMYSIFMAVTSQLGISFKLAIHLLYIMASLVFLFAIRRLISNRFALLVAFIIVLLNPITLSKYWVYPARLNVYIPLVLIYFSALVALVGNGFKDSSRFSLNWTLLASCALAVAWNTREESIWLIPGLLPLLGLTVFYVVRKPRQWSGLILWVVFLSIPVMTSAILSKENEERYGFDGIVDFKLPQFNRAVNALLSLNTSEERSRIAITDEVRDKLLEISTTTRKLVTFDEDGNPNPIRSITTHVTWILRNRMEVNGFYTDIESTEAEYKTMADDIEQYCEANANQCRPTILPGIITKKSDLKNIIPIFIKGLEDFVDFKRFNPPDRKEIDDLLGGQNFRYAVSRSLHLPVAYDAEAHVNNKIERFESSRIQKIGRIHAFYQNYFYLFCVFAFIGLVTAVSMKQYRVLWAGLVISIGFSAAYTIYVLLSAFVADLGRIYAISLTPIIALVGLFAGVFLQNLGCLLKRIITAVRAA